MHVFRYTVSSIKQAKSQKYLAFFAKTSIVFQKFFFTFCVFREIFLRFQQNYPSKKILQTLYTTNKKTIVAHFSKNQIIYFLIAKKKHLQEQQPHFHYKFCTVTKKPNTLFNQTSPIFTYNFSLRISRDLYRFRRVSAKLRVPSRSEKKFFLIDNHLRSNSDASHSSWRPWCW